jgi:hypothetical protein
VDLELIQDRINFAIRLKIIQKKNYH